METLLAIVYVLAGPYDPAGWLAARPDPAAAPVTAEAPVEASEVTVDGRARLALRAAAGMVYVPAKPGGLTKAALREAVCADRMPEGRGETAKPRALTAAEAALADDILQVISKACRRT